ncbi:MAG: hypothetical protein V4664_00430 [Patescibacteria group bacterium]
MKDGTIDKKAERMSLLIDHLIALMEANPGETAFKIDTRSFSKKSSNPFEDVSKLESTLNALAEKGGIKYSKQTEVGTHTVRNSVAFYGEQRTITLISYNIDILKSADKLRKKKVSFILDSVLDPVMAKLYLENTSPDLFYKMEKDGLRYKLLHFLAKSRRFIITSTLADKFDTDIVKIRRSIENMRGQISKKFELPRDSIFENDPSTGAGYKVDNVNLID